MSMRETLNALRADFKAGKHPPTTQRVIHSVMVRATAEPIASGQAGGTKSVQASASTWPFCEEACGGFLVVLLARVRSD
ncbi:hypothetical protein P3T23_008554 [Paraburkholderia sp. GAS448]